jgi:prepilin-type N-terminal cleavage/methylation domain-containing protein
MQTRHQQSNQAVSTGILQPEASRVRGFVFRPVPRGLVRGMCSRTRAAGGGARASLAFTLMELLIVVAIIGLLAAILLPTYGLVKKRSMISTTRLEMKTLISAIDAYESVYNQLPPLSREALDSVERSSPDFTCGTVRSDGTQVCDTKIISTGNGGYQNCNSEVMTILMDMDAPPNAAHARNPQRSLFYHGQSAPNNGHGVGRDGILRDCWASPYIITFDVDYDGKCQDGFYYPLTKPTGALLVRGSVMVWSLGPDRKADPSCQVGPKGGANKDNILSWEN